MTEAALAEELGVSKAEIRRAADAEETIVVVSGRAERTYGYQPLTEPFVRKYQESSDS